MASDCSVIERLVQQFCGCLYGDVRLEPRDRPQQDSHRDVQAAAPWFAVRLAADEPSCDGQPPSSAPLRAKLEAICVLSVVACCRGFTWDQNPAFWHQFLTPREEMGPPPLRTMSKRARAQRKAASECDPARATAAGRLCEYERGRVPSFMLDLSFMEITADVLSLCRHFLLAQRKPKHFGMRKSFTRAMDTLHAMVPIGFRRRPQRIPLGLRFGRCFLKSNESTTMEIRLLVEAVAARADQFIRSSRLDRDYLLFSCVYFDACHLDFSRAMLSKQGFAHVANLLASPVNRVRELSMGKVFNDRGNGFMGSFGLLMTECFATNNGYSESLLEPSSQAASGNDGVAAAKVQHLVFDWNVLNNFYLSALFSAIHCSTAGSVTAQQLSLQGAFRRFEGSNPSMPWMWLAFAMLQSDSTSAVQQLDLSRNPLREEDVEAMQRIIRADQAGELLLGGSFIPASSISAEQSAKRAKHLVCVAKHTQMWPFPNTKAPVVLQLKQQTRCQALSKGRKWTCVLVPGYGDLWVLTKQLITAGEITVPASHPCKESKRALRSLVMDAIVTAEPVHRVLAAFMPVVGASLQSLQLRENSLTNQTLATIIQSCPNLTHLDIAECELNTIAALLDAYERNSCRIAVLNVADNQIGSQDVRRLCWLLQDRHCVAVHALRSLTLEQNPIGRPGLQAIFGMLGCNRTLEHLVLDQSEDPIGYFRSRFHAFDNELLTIEPWPVERRLALLSVAQAFPQVAAIDAAVMTMLFELLRVRVQRQIVWT